MALQRRRVSVTFVGDDDVVKHIIPINERKSNLRQRGKKGPRKRSVSYADEMQEESDSGEEEAEVFRPSEALVDENDIGGNEVFGFKSSKRTGQMAQRASESAHAVTPSTPKTNRTPKSVARTPKSAAKTPRSTTQTPKSILKKTTQSGNTEGTPRRSGRVVRTEDAPSHRAQGEATPRRSGRAKRKMEATTPYRLQARNRMESSSEESVSEDEDSSDSDEDLGVTPLPTKQKGPQKTPKTPAGRKRRRQREEEELPDTVEDYFDIHSFGVVTSDRTLSKLDTPRMDQEALSSALTGVDIGYMKERSALYDEHRSLFNQWMYQLCNGYNLLLHGLGSKRRLIEDFRSTMLHDFTHVVVNGYFPSITIKSILNAITEDVLEHKGSFRSPVDQCEFIRKHYECGEYEDFYLIVHNIDGSMLRPEKVQMVLSLMAQITGFHIIASIDHINAPLIWDQTKASRFNWLWYDVTTFDPYKEETSYENSLLVQQSGVLALSSLTHVMKSLTPNAKGIFFLLARHQLENKDNQTYIGLAFPDLYQRCREAFLVNSDLTLRTQLIEFRDHKLIKFKKVDGVEYLIIPLDPATLKEFLEQSEDEN